MWSSRLSQESSPTSASSEEKTCARCAFNKSLQDFSKDRKRSDGLNVYCFDCTRARNRESYGRNKANESERKRAAYQANRDRFLARNREWRDANRDREREQHKEYYRKNPATFIRRGANRKAAWSAIDKFTVTQRHLERELERHGNACAYCFVRFVGLTVTWDHVVPVSRGGTHGIGNLVPACRSCNSAKGSRTVMEWRAS